MAGTVQVTPSTGGMVGEGISMNKAEYGVDILCLVCKEDKGEKCEHFVPPNKNVYVCNRFEKR